MRSSALFTVSLRNNPIWFNYFVRDTFMKKKRNTTESWTMISTVFFVRLLGVQQSNVCDAEECPLHGICNITLPDLTVNKLPGL
jgi:hypothetical protein